MKKLFSLLFSLIISLATYAQTNIKGNVIDSETREPVIGATVIVEGTTKGAITDAEGAFFIQSVTEGTNLQVSMMSYDPVVVAAKAGQMTIELLTSSLAVDEVVVTALNLTKEKKVLGYAVQEVKGKELATSRDANPMSSLVGKVAGMTVSIPSDLLAAPTISVRGVEPIIVVDGVPVASDTWNISPDDIESISVLKGPTAAALYGSAGKNGAVQITTKRGTGDKNRSFTVSLNSSTTFQTSYIAIPEVQTAYGAGNNFTYSFGDGYYGNINGVNNLDANVWGPRFEGQLIKQYNSPMDENGIRTATPWLSVGKDNLKNFMQTGITSTNNITIAQQSEAGDFRASISDSYQKGLFPNTALNSFNVNLTGTMNLGKKATLQASLNYNDTSSPNYPDATYQPRSPIYNLVVWRGSEFDVRDLKNYWIPGMEGLQQYNTDYAQYNNPWFMAEENLREYSKEDVHGQVSFNYRFTPDLDLRVRSSLSSYNQFEDEKYPVSASFYGDMKWVGGYDEIRNGYSDSNTDVLLNYAKQLTQNFGIKASAGGSYRIQSANHSYTTTMGGLIVPGIYTLQNSVETTTGTSSSWTKEIGSIYGYVDLDFKDYLFLSVTGRMDSSSTLPIDNNTYFYPSVSLSGVVSDMFELPDAISFWRVRASYAKVGSDLDVYSLANTYEQSNIWNGQTPMYMNSQLLSNNIKPEFSTSYEIGTDLRLFKNRLSIDASYFYALDGPQIFSMSTATSSGYNSRLVNGLTYSRKGWELVFAGTPIRTNKVTWEMNLNLSSSHSYLEEVYDGVLNDGNIKVSERIDQLWVTDFMRSAAGEIIYKDGMPVRDEIDKYWGNYDHDLKFGFGTAVKYGQFSLNMSLDGGIGGQIVNSTWENLWRSGTHIDSDNKYRYADWMAYNTDPNSYGKSYTGTLVGDGVVVTGGELVRDQNGNVISDNRTYEKNSETALYQNWAGGSDGYYRTETQYIQDRTYVKLRDVTLTYNIPSHLLSSLGGMRSASISFVGRNLFYLSKADFIDLDQFTGAGTVLQTPSTRNFGFNINLTF